MFSALLLLALELPPEPDVLPATADAPVPRGEYSRALKAWVYPPDADGFQWTIPARGSVFSLGFLPEPKKKIFGK
jgi:hypothetical protein